MERMAKVIKWARDLIFPPACAFCGKLLSNRMPHPDCERGLPLIENPVCPFCGVGEDYCTCEKKPGAVTRTAAPFYYRDAAKDAIKRLKFAGAAYAAERLGDEMAKTVSTRFCGVTFDLVVPVPMEREKQRDRGYNQAALLAKRVASRLSIPFLPHALVVVGFKKEQHALDKAARKRNVRGVYGVDPAAHISGKHILLVDDICTTGATLEECAKMLKKSGAASIYAAICARVVAN